MRMFFMEIMQYIDTQRKERYKSFIIYGPPLFGKTKLAKELSLKINGLYFDLLLYFTSDEALKKDIDIFGPGELKKFLCQKDNFNEKFILVDNMDFLVNTWNESQKEYFLSFVEKDESSISYIFFMQLQSIFNKRNLVNVHGHSRIINIYDIQ